MDAYSDDEWKDSDDEEKPAVNEVVVQKRSYVLIAIDIDSSMFITDGTSHSPFVDCLKACFDMYSSLVLARSGSVKGPVSIILADNKASKATFIDFEQAIPDAVKLLKEYTSLNSTDLKNRFLRKEEFDLGDFFLFCKTKLSSISGDVYKKSIYYITNNDDPVGNDAQKRFKIINEAQKFAELNITLSVVTFKSNFDKEGLYSEVLAASKGSPIEIITNASDLTNEISKLVKRQFTKYRMKFYPFLGDTESYLDLVINKFVKGSTMLKNMYVTRDTQKEVKKVTKQQVFSAEYNCSYNNKVQPLILNGSEKSYLTDTNIPVGLTLIHVGNETSKKGWIIEPSALIEKHFSETRVIFDAFWQYCKENSKCLVCLRKYRKGADAYFVELVPTFINNRRMFLSKTLPFGSDIRYTPKALPNVTFSAEAENVMGSLVDCLTFNYDPLHFPDPVESKKIAYLKSQLLDEPLEEIDDRIPVDAEVDEKINYFLKKLRGLNLPETGTAGKRSTATAARGGSRKRGKNN